MKTETFIKFVCAELYGIFVLLFGEMNGMLAALLIAMCLDMLTGIIVGAMEHRLDSRISFRGIGKKVLILLLVGLAHALDTWVLETPMTQGIVEGFYIANEGMSIIENAGKFIPLPKKLRDVFVQLKSDDDKEDEDHDSTGE